ncbi:MAG: glucokinase [Caldilineaceae bacterium]|nr:glucokinase [Caldilineaceae bacterium]
MKFIAGDIGGTKTVLAIYDQDSGPASPLAEATFPSAAYPNLEAIVRTFLVQQQSIGVDLVGGTFGVAGPVVNGRATITNLPWRMDEQKLAQELSLPRVTLINDLVAIASAVPALPPSDLHTINQGQAVENGPIAVVAPGTGLGEAYLIHNGERYQAYPSEGGHVDFGPNNADETELLLFLQKKLGAHGSAHVSWERVCSGSGIPNIYEFVKQRGDAVEDPAIAAQIAQSGDVAPIVINNGLRDDASSLCRQTLELFLGILGSEAGNMALKVLATGGVYLGGGIPPRILAALAQPTFMQAFLNKGRLSTVLREMPVHVILNPKAALLGAAYHGFVSA